MRLHWFSPLPPARTEIANFTARTAPVLASHFSLTFWTDAKKWDRQIEESGPVRFYTAAAISSELPESEPSIFNIGNDRRFHAEILRLCLRGPGIVILHDLNVTELVSNIAREGSESPRTLSIFEAQPRGDVPLATRIALANATAVLVHTRRAATALKAELSCPVIFSPLPYSASKLEPRIKNDSAIRHLIIFGFLGQNRRLQSVLGALATYDRKNQLRLDIYGDIQNKRKIVSEIRRLRLRGHVRLHGFVSDEELAGALRTSDLAINLRYPTMGESSASLLKSWDQALPALVTKDGAYADLPEGVVGYVINEKEIEDLHHHFDRLLEEPEFYREIGRRGREELLSHHQPDAYAKALKRLIELAQGPASG